MRKIIFYQPTRYNTKTYSYIIFQTISLVEKFFYSEVVFWNFSLLSRDDDDYHFYFSANHFGFCIFYSGRTVVVPWYFFSSCCSNIVLIFAYCCCCRFSRQYYHHHHRGSRRREEIWLLYILIQRIFVCMCRAARWWDQNFMDVWWWRRPAHLSNDTWKSSCCSLLFLW